MNVVLCVRSVHKLVGTATVIGLGRVPIRLSSATQLAERIRQGDASLAQRLSADGGSYLDEQRLWYAHGASPSASLMQLAHSKLGLTSHEIRFGDAKDRREVYEWLGAAASREVPLDARVELVMADRTKISIGWHTPFEASAQPEEFHGVSGSASVPFLNRIGTFGVLEASEALFVRVPLKAHLSMWMYVPRPSQSLASPGFRWVPNALGLMKSRPLPVEVADLHFPKFSVDATSSIIATVRNDAAAAHDLGIDDVASIVPPLTNVIQVAQFAATERGISMSATTVGYRKKKAQRQPRKITVDHPFGFLVRDDATGEFLMVGSVVQL